MELNLVNVTAQERVELETIVDGSIWRLTIDEQTLNEVRNMRLVAGTKHIRCFAPRDEENRMVSLAGAKFSKDLIDAGYVVANVPTVVLNPHRFEI